MKRFLPILLLVLLSACASSGDFDYLRREIASLKAVGAESRDGFKKDIEELKKEDETTRRNIDILKEKTSGTVKEESFSAVRESQAEMTSRVSEALNGLQELRGRFEENKYSIEKNLRDSSAEKDLLRAQIANTESQLKSVKDKLEALESAFKARESTEKSGEQKPETDKTAPAASEKNGTVPQGGAVQETPEKKDVQNSAIKTYDAAYQAFKDKKYKEARGKFEIFIKDQPGNDLTDNAQYWIGESYYAEKDYESAILAYETLLKKYPDSDKSAGALLKQGLAFIEIGDKKTGKIIFGKLIDKYPSSKEAGLAKKKIAETEKKSSRKK